MQTQENDTLTFTSSSRVQFTCVLCCFPVLAARVKFHFRLMMYLYTITDKIHFSPLSCSACAFRCIMRMRQLEELAINVTQLRSTGMGDHYSLEVRVILACELHYSLYRGGMAGTLQNCKLPIANCLHFFYMVQNCISYNRAALNRFTIVYTVKSLCSI